MEAEATWGCNLEAYQFFCNMYVIDQDEKFTINIHEVLKGISIHFWPPWRLLEASINTYTI